MRKIYTLILLTCLTWASHAQQTCNTATTIVPANACNYSSYTTNGTDYWLKFVAASKNVNISLITTAFGTNATHIHHIELISGTCVNQTIIAEDELPFVNSADKLAIDLDASNLTIGATYYIRVERPASVSTCDKATCKAAGSTNPSVFNICVQNIDVIVPLDFGLELPSNSHAYVTNRGQLTNINGNPVPAVKLYSIHSNPAVFIADNYTSFVFKKSDNNNSTPDSLHRVDMSLVNANTNLKVFKTEQTPGITNFFYPHIPAGVTGNKSFFRSVCNSVYQNIDMQFYSNRDGVKFYFTVRPGGNADNIVLKFDGATSVNVTSSGGLKVVTPLGNIEYEAPHAYQVNPAGNIVPMPWQANFIQVSPTSVKFDIRNYPANMPLFIQVDKGHSAKPQHVSTPEWSMYYGGNGYDEGTDVTIDTDGNAYFCGFTNSSDFPTTAGAFQSSGVGQFDAFITKIGSANGATNGIVQNADKNIWTTYWGGNNDDKAFGITTIGNGTSGRVFVTGYTESTNLLTYNNAGIYHQTTLSGTRDAFIIGLDNLNGGQNAVNRWVSYFGGNGDENSYAIKKDVSGNIYIAGNTSTNFYTANTCIVPTDNGFPSCNTSSTFNNSGSYGGGTTDAFIARFNPTGQLQWSTFYGGNQEDVINDIDFDNSGILYITGQTASTVGFPITSFGNYNQSSFGTGINDAFIARFDASLTHQWCSYFGGNGNDAGLALSIDANNNVYMAGETSSSTPACTTCLCTVPATGEFPLCPQSGSYFQGTGNLGLYGGGTSDGFIAKFNPSLNFIWGTYYGGNNTDKINGLDVDFANRLFFTGQTFSNDPMVNFKSNIYKIGPNAWDYNQNYLDGPTEAFLGYFDAANTRIWSSYYGDGNMDETSNAIAVYATSPFNHFWYITGATNTSPTGFHTFANNDNCCP